MKLFFILSLIAVLFSGVFAFKFFHPKIDLKKEAEKKIREISKKQDNVLGEEENNQEDVISQEKIAGQLKELPAQILQQEIVKETVEKVNQIVEQKVNEIKNAPKKQLETTKKEVKKNVCREICGEWMAD